MKLVSLCFFVYSLYCMFATGKTHSKKDDDRRSPNIIFILIDDLGHSDAGFNQIEPFTSNNNPNVYFKTSNIDRLAMEEGLILERHYVHSNCSPTRGALLTGTYPHRNTNGITLALTLFDDIALNVTYKEQMFPYVLSKYGNYKTLITGKWHLGHDSNKNSPIEYFDNHLFGFQGFTDYWRHTACAQQIAWPTLLPNWGYISSTDIGNELRAKYPFDTSGICFYDLWKDIDEPFDNITTYTNDTYVEDLFYQKIETFLIDNYNYKSDSRKSRKSHKSNSHSSESKSKSSSRSKSSSSSDDDRLSSSSSSSSSSSDSDSSDESTDDNNNKEEQPFFIYYPSYLAHAPIQKPPSNINNNNVNYNNCDLIINEGRKVLCEMIQYIDYEIGKLEMLLKELNLWENTVIVISGDNGGFPSLNYEDRRYFEMLSGFGTNLPLRGVKGTTFEGGIRSTSFITGGYLPNNLKGQSYNKLIAIEDWYSTFINLANIDIDDINDELNELNELNDALNQEIELGMDSFDIWPDIIKYSQFIKDKSKTDNKETETETDELETETDESKSERPIRTDWIEISVTGGACLVRDDGYKYVLNGKNTLEILLNDDTDYFEFDGTNSLLIENLNYSKYETEMVFNVFNDEYEFYNLVNSSDINIQHIILEMKNTFQNHLNDAFLKDGSNSLKGFKAAIDFGSIYPWKDNNLYSNISDDIQTIESVYQLLLD